MLHGLSHSLVVHVTRLISRITLCDEAGCGDGPQMSPPRGDHGAWFTGAVPPGVGVTRHRVGGHGRRRTLIAVAGGARRIRR